MILSASRRTDIPAFYSKWFMNRLHEGYVLVRNPFNYHQVSKISLDPAVIDCIVFWTKNAAPMIPYIDEISSRYKYYFQYSLNGYDRSIEQNIASLESRINTFRTLSEKSGPEKVVWRYDPVLITDNIGINWHIEQFRVIASELKGHTKTCVFSFIDLYDKMKNNVSELGIHACSTDEMKIIASAFSEIARSNDMVLQTCAEEIDLGQYGIQHGCCIDKTQIEKISGRVLHASKDKNQREACGCLESIDIGQYNTCRHGCKYCYANFNPQSVITFSKQHDPNSPFLIGHQEETDKITERKMKSLLGEASGQISMFI